MKAFPGLPAFLALAAAGLMAGCSTPPTPEGYDPAQKAANYSQSQGQSGDGQVQQSPFWSSDKKQKTMTNQPPLDTLNTLNPTAPVPAAPAPAP